MGTGDHVFFDDDNAVLHFENSLWGNLYEGMDELNMERISFEFLDERSLDLTSQDFGRPFQVPFATLNQFIDVMRNRVGLFYGDFPHLEPIRRRTGNLPRRVRRRSRGNLRSPPAEEAEE